MWMLERNKEVMKKWDEDSFAVTGWVEGDTSVLFSEDRPKGSVTKDGKSSEVNAPKPANESLGAPQGLNQEPAVKRRENVLTPTTALDQADAKSPETDIPRNSKEDAASAMQVDVPGANRER